MDLGSVGSGIEKKGLVETKGIIQQGNTRGDKLVMSSTGQSGFGSSSLSTTGTGGGLFGSNRYHTLGLQSTSKTALMVGQKGNRQ